MQSFVGKLTHACPVYYCSRSARPRALPAGLSVVAADWPHVSNSGYDGSMDPLVFNIMSSESESSSGSAMKSHPGAYASTDASAGGVLKLRYPHRRDS